MTYATSHMAYVHFIHQKGVIAKRLLPFVPNVGDEVRIKDGEYFKVTLVVWVLDEDDSPYQRVNVGLADVGASK
jgi:hypothetical protein